MLSGCLRTLSSLGSCPALPECGLRLVTLKSTICPETTARSAPAGDPPRALRGGCWACPAPVRCRRLWVLRGLEPRASGDSATAEVPASHAGCPPAYSPDSEQKHAHTLAQGAGVELLGVSNASPSLPAETRFPAPRATELVHFLQLRDFPKLWPGRAAGVSFVACRGSGEVICKS